MCRDTPYPPAHLSRSRRLEGRGAGGVRAESTVLISRWRKTAKIRWVDELLNPFRPGAGTPPPELVGRDGLIDTFGVTLRRAMAGRPGKSLLLVGLRGVGKTVLLSRFAEIAELEGAAVGYLEATDEGDFQSQLAQRLRRIP